MYAKNPFLLHVLGYFNAQTNKGHNQSKTTQEYFKIYGMTSQPGLQRMIKEPTHGLNDLRSNCIDLIFTSQLNLVME